MAEELDDWLEDLGDEESESADELDQSDIDSLLSGGDSSDGSGDDASDGELDQSDIDALLSGDDSSDGSGDVAAADELDQSDIDSLLSGDDSSDGSVDDAVADELDQSDIDSLLSGDDSSDSSGDVVDADELDQSDIDSLLSGDDSSDEAKATVPVDDLIDQSNIDDLLSGTSEDQQGDQQELSPDQEEIDRLFSEIDEDADEPDPFQAEEIEFDDLLSNETDDTFLSTGNEFASDEFDLDDDVPEIPEDEEATLFETREDGGASQDAGASTKGALPGDLSEEGAPVKDGTGFTLPISIPAILLEKRSQAIVGGIFVVLLVALVFMFTRKGDSPEDIAQPVETPQIQDIAEPASLPVQVANKPPQVDDVNVTVDKGEPTAIILVAHDAEGDALQYELLSQPEHGKLSGAPPNLVYIPSSEFPGKDRFDFRVNDGKDDSLPAVVSISGEVIRILPPQPEPEKVVAKAIKPRRLIVQANNFSYSITGTEPFFIDWQRVWSDANFLPYSKQITVEIISKGQHGGLKKTSDNVSAYTAKKYFGGKDSIRYRFALGRVKSKIRKISLNIFPGNPPPEIKMATFDQSYRPGEMVLLDASNSLDDKRQSLTFTWQQLSGPNVQLAKLNPEGSRVSFVAPSSFNTVPNPGPLMRLTVSDSSGKKDIREVKITTKSRYKSAIWGSVATGGY